MTLLPFDVLDHIFGFLKYNPRSLLACSLSHPFFAQIVERYLYYHVIIPSATSYQTDHRRGYRLESWRIIKLLSEAPKVVDHVCILELSLRFLKGGLRSFEVIAPILSKFHALRCLRLTSPTSEDIWWQDVVPLCFRTALEDCLRLPTLQEVHINYIHFPIFVLNDIPNITRLSISHSLETLVCSKSPFPQLESLSLYHIDSKYRPYLIAWGKHHIAKLRSLTCDYSDENFVLELVRICSDSLESLDISMVPPSGSELPSHVWNLKSS